MNLNELIKYFGSQRRASLAIGRTKQASSLWKKRGFIPFDAQKEFEIISNGELIAEDREKMAEYKKERVMITDDEKRKLLKKISKYFEEYRKLLSQLEKDIKNKDIDKQTCALFITNKIFSFTKDLMDKIKNQALQQ